MIDRLNNYVGYQFPDWKATTDCGPVISHLAVLAMWFGKLTARDENGSERVLWITIGVLFLPPNAEGQQKRKQKRKAQQMIHQIEIEPIRRTQRENKPKKNREKSKERKQK